MAPNSSPAAVKDGPGVFSEASLMIDIFIPLHNPKRQNLPWTRFSPPPTHHSSSVSLHELHDAGGVFVPQVDVSTVAAADHKLAARPVEVHPLHWETGRARGGGVKASVKVE